MHHGIQTLIITMLNFRNSLLLLVVSVKATIWVCSRAPTAPRSLVPLRFHIWLLHWFSVKIRIMEWKCSVLPTHRSESFVYKSNLASKNKAGCSIKNFPKTSPSLHFEDLALCTLCLEKLQHSFSYNLTNVQLFAYPASKGQAVWWVGAKPKISASTHTSRMHFSATFALVLFMPWHNTYEMTHK